MSYGYDVISLTASEEKQNKHPGSLGKGREGRGAERESPFLLVFYPKPPRGPVLTSWAMAGQIPTTTDLKSCLTQ